MAKLGQRRVLGPVQLTALGVGCIIGTGIFVLTGRAAHDTTGPALMLSFVVAIAIGWWFGGVLDAWLGTSPWLMLLLSGFGLAAGVLNVYRTVSRAMKAPARPESHGD